VCKSLHLDKSREWGFTFEHFCGAKRKFQFKPLGILKSPHATTVCGAPSRSSDLNGQGRPPLQGGEGLNVV
jgi:hypothetical protein